MTPEQIARRYEDFAGFELVDYAEAALPLWQLNVEAVSVMRRGLQPMRERALSPAIVPDSLASPRRSWAASWRFCYRTDT